MNQLICPNPQCLKISGLEVYAVVVARGSVPISSMRWLRIQAAPDGHLEGEIAERLPQRWDATSNMRCSSCGHSAAAEEFGLTETVELNHDLLTLGLQGS
jgi:hypothetical protein